MITAILFTDLVDEEGASRRASEGRSWAAFRAHRRLLSEAVRPRGGREVQWLGNGLMVTFSSVSDALDAAVALQQAARWPVDGVRLAIRVGLDLGETLCENRDHFGTTVVVARRLCDRAEGGQILCSALVAELLGRARALRFQRCGALSIDGMAAPVDACEVLYEDGRPRSLARRTEPATSRRAQDFVWPTSPEPRGLGGVPRRKAAGGVAEKLYRCLLWIRSRSF